ncbi:MAG: hypothetical protein IPK81_12775 [Rhodospirillales bacterium]|nr:hypothetical protein [Rhodospirillales bacterium]QQS10545.1 MAG: hypothetical protein IPK81_12775 [Rhodospirillales bacterium]
MTDTQAAVDPAAIAVIDRYIDALNRGDLDGVRAAFHFPHVMLAAGGVEVYPTAPELSFESFYSRVLSQGWVRSTFDGHRVLMAAPDKLHLDVWFTRLRGDDSVISVHHSMYILTRVDGKWGLQARSSFG